MREFGEQEFKVLPFSLGKLLLKGFRRLIFQNL